MSLRSLRVLIVDDDPDAAELVALIISGLGCECRTVSTAIHALAAAEQLQPHIVVLDLTLADGSGSSVARTLRRLRGNSVYLVAFTGSHRTSDHVLSDGFDVHIMKPASPAVLRDVIARAAEHLS